MRPEDLTVEVRDINLKRVGQIRPEDLNLTISDVYNDIGSWELKLPVEHPMVPVLRTPGSGLIVTHRSGQVLMSGPTVKPEVDATVDDPFGTATIDGVTDSVHMGDRLAVPDPTNPSLDDQGLAHDVRTGTLEDLMYAFVNANAGPGAPVERRVKYLTLAESQHRGATATKSVRFSVLGNVLNELAAGTYLRWRIVQQGDVLVFQVDEASDKTGLIRLDINNNTLSGSKVATSPPGVTRVLVAGQGNLADRQFIEVTDEAALAGEQLWGRRIEQFLDQRQTSDEAELLKAGQDALADAGFASISVQVTPMEDSSMEFLETWFLGDQVTVVVQGQETQSLVTGYVIKADGDQGTRVGAVLGDVAGFNSGAALEQRVDGIEDRLSNLERNGEIPPSQPGITFLDQSLFSNATPPSGYPDGWSEMYVDAEHGIAGGWDMYAGRNIWGIFRTLAWAGDNSDTTQFWATVGSQEPEEWVRSGHIDTWGPWRKLAVTQPGSPVQLLDGGHAEADPATAYPLGISLMSVGDGSGWSLNNGYGLILTSHAGETRTYQEFHDHTNHVTWQRYYYNSDGTGGWSEWQMQPDPEKTPRGAVFYAQATPGVSNISTGEQVVWSPGSATFPAGRAFRLTMNVSVQPNQDTAYYWARLRTGTGVSGQVLASTGWVPGSKATLGRAEGWTRYFRNTSTSDLSRSLVVTVQAFSGTTVNTNGGDGWEWVVAIDDVGPASGTYSAAKVIT